MQRPVGRQLVRSRPRPRSERHARRSWPVHSAALAILLAMACGDYGVFLPSVPDDGTDEGNTIQVAPKPGLSVARWTDLGPLKESPLILGRDGGMSGTFADRAVWLYGDTLFDTGGGIEMMSNSWAWTHDRNASDGVDLSFPEFGGEPAPLLLETPEEREFDAAHDPSHCSEEPCGARWALWPLAVVKDPARHRGLVFYSKVYAEEGLFRFVSVGQSVALWTGVDEPADRRIDPATGETPFLFTEGDVAFGNARILEGDQIYAYGCQTTGWEKECKVARAPLSNALEPHAWSYYGSAGWTFDPLQAVSVIEANDIMSVAYNQYLGAYLAVYAPPRTNQVMMRFAPRPEGPWSEAVPAFSTLTPVQLWVYDAQAHPEYEEDQGRVQYVTYTLVTSDRTSEMRLVRVEISDENTANFTSHVH